MNCQLSRDTTRILSSESDDFGNRQIELFVQGLFAVGWSSGHGDFTAYGNTALDRVRPEKKAELIRIGNGLPGGILLDRERLQLELATVELKPGIARIGDEGEVEIRG